MKITLISTSTFPADQGLRTISACLKEAGHDVKIIFLPLPEDYSIQYPQDVLNQVKAAASGSKLIGINAMASTNERAQQLIDMFKEMSVPVIWGGPHPTFFPEKCFEMCDIIAVGEAEEAFVELANKIEKNENISDIKNLYVRASGKEFKNPVRPAAEDLDVYPHPDYDLENHRILENGRLIPFEERHLGGMIFFQTERGCPQACTYCTNNVLRKLYKGNKILRSHSVDYVIKELVRLKNKFSTIGVFDIRDETFLVRDANWLREFSERYKNEVGIRFKCLAEPASMATEGLSEEKIKMLVDAGLTDIIIGIQSGSDRLNKELYNRFITGKQVLKCALVLNKFSDKLAIMYDIIATNPYETPEDVLETINLIRQLPPPYYLSVNNLVFFEGTPLYDKAVREGLITDIDPTSKLNYWDRWNHIKQKKTNEYLNLLLNLMRGKCKGKRYGVMPEFLLKQLLKPGIVKTNQKVKAFTYFVGYNVMAADYFRENVAKPVYRSMPLSVKLWYDKVRYRAE